ncbi:MAG: hypothetical protein ACE15C_04515 [Phycisphaerae bacterium]
MTKTRVVLSLSFSLAFAAGLSLGVLIARPARTAQPQSRLAAELNLNAEQQEKMRGIWEEAQASFRQYGERRMALSQEREQNISALLSDDQHARYDAIRQEYSRKQDEASRALSQEREQAISAMLPEDQRARYEAIQQDYARKSEKLSQERRKIFDQAAERTLKEVLNPDQAKKYEDILKKQRERGFRRRYVTTAASRPATMEAGIPRVGE